MDQFWIETPCPAPSEEHIARARTRQANLTKPPGSLGALEEIALRLAGLQAKEIPTADHATIIVFAADHGVTAQGVSAFPSDVTVEMLKNFASGGAAISVLARTLNAPLVLVDVGTHATAPIDGVITDKRRSGSRDISRESAMTAEERDHALATGREHALEAANAGADIILLGEMGIGNTTSAAAVAASLLGTSATDLAGRGTGLDDAAVDHKARVIEAALKLHGANKNQVPPLEALRCLGGFEIAALTGAILAAAQARLPVFVDGFIVSTAALIAVKLNPTCRPWLIFAHRSAEQGHRHILSALNAEPLLDLDMRLGEGSGAAVALGVIRSALALHANMATFAEAAISGPVDHDRHS